MLPRARTRTHRLLATLLLGAFIATASGASLLELAWHFSHGGDAHVRAPHFEAAGGTAHADHCQVGLVHAGGRLPEGEPTRLCHAPVIRLFGPIGVLAGPAPASPAVALPRAPPSFG